MTLERFMAAVGITTKTELCLRAGITQMTLWRIEHGEYCRQQTLSKLGSVLGVGVADLFMLFYGETK